MISYNECVRASKRIGELFRTFGAVRIRLPNGTRVTETITKGDGSVETRRMVVRGTFCYPETDEKPTEVTK